MKPFSPEADAVIANAFDWLRQRELNPPAPVVVARLYRHGMTFSEQDATVLRSMAEHSGWIERGGMAIRELSKYQTGGDVIGRTQWIGQPEWARGFGYSRDDIQAIVEKAIAGEALGTKQTLLMQAMLDVMAESQAQPIPF